MPVAADLQEIIDGAHVRAGQASSSPA
jgi:hypothetical protein